MGRCPLVSNVMKRSALAGECSCDHWHSATTSLRRGVEDNALFALLLFDELLYVAFFSQPRVLSIEVG